MLWQGTGQGGELDPARSFAFGDGGQRREPIRSVSIHPTQSQLASGDDLGNLTLWNFDGALIKRIPAHGDRLNGLQYSPNGQYLLSGGRDGIAKIWSMDGELLHSLKSDPLPIEHIAISPNSEWIATAVSDGIIRLWDHNGNLRAEFQGLPGGIESLGFNDTGDQLMAVNQNGNMQFWPVTPEKERLSQLVRQGCDWLGDYIAANNHRPQVLSLNFCQ